MVLRKVKVTDGMSHDCYIFETNASDIELQEWANKVSVAMYNGDDSYFLDWLAENHFVKLLYDSEVDREEMENTIECDLYFDMSEKRRLLKCLEEKSNGFIGEKKE